MHTLIVSIISFSYNPVVFAMGENETESYNQQKLQSPSLSNSSTHSMKRELDAQFNTKKIAIKKANERVNNRLDLNHSSSRSKTKK